MLLRHYFNFNANYHWIVEKIYQLVIVMLQLQAMRLHFKRSFQKHFCPRTLYV